VLDFYKKEDQAIHMSKINLIADKKTVLKAQHK